MAEHDNIEKNESPPKTNISESKEPQPYTCPYDPQDEFLDYDIKNFKNPADRVIELEFETINTIRQKDGDKERGTTEECIGIALSGGGIRSSTFSLGVLQALAREKWLKKVDYLSTVSGGGYIGSSLTWLLSQKEYTTNDGESYPINLSQKNFPYGTRLPGKPDGGSLWQNAILRYLRQHGKYLIPGKGITIFSFIAVFLRGLILNLIVYFPPIVLIFYVLNQWGWLGVPPFKPPTSSQNLFWEIIQHNFLLILACGLATLFALSVIPYSLTAFLSRYVKKESDNSESGGGWYQTRRWYERWAGTGLSLTIVLLVLGLIPLIHEYTQLDPDQIEENSLGEFFTGLSSLIAGIGAGIGAYIKSGEKKKGKIPMGVWVWAGAFLIIFGFFYISFITSLWVQVPPNEFFNLTNRGLWLLIIIPLVVGLFTNMNFVSVHRYYRDRLMETFMPKVKEVENARVRRAPLADGDRLSTMNEKRPYHIVNTNIVLVDSGIAKFKGRGGDNFILSPLYCGSNATGWRHTASYMNDAITLPTAMAISGAALNPNTGVGGEGVTRNRLLSIVLTLLNLRLGFWGSNPRKSVHFNWPANFIFPCPFFKMNEHHRYIQLTDGGHFENLALYELIRRRLKIILICDGAADPDFHFADLGNLAEKIRVDFGAQLKINTEPLIPDKKTNKASQGYILGKIIYSDGEHGTLIYLKTTYIDGLDQDVVAYKNNHPEFPDQSTADQFFDEKQFEAYRQLGYQIAHKMIGDVTTTGKKAPPQPGEPTEGENIKTKRELYNRFK